MFKPGQSGNPGGRAKGPSRITKLRELLDPHAPALLQKVIDMGLEGDPTALKIIFDKLLPRLNHSPKENLYLLETYRDKVNGLWQMVCEDKITPDEFKELSAGLMSLAKIEETTELKKYIENIQEKLEELKKND